MDNQLPDLEKAKETTELWISRTIIGLNLCPFAQKPFEKKQVRVAALQSASFEDLQEDFDRELKLLQQSSANIVSNSFLVFPNLKKSFEEFYDIANTLEEIYQLDSKTQAFQLVVFHPNFRFFQSPPDEKGNLVNASPYPSLHLLRRLEVSEALKNFQSGISIAHQNQSKINNLSNEQINYYWWFLSK